MAFGQPAGSPIKSIQRGTITIPSDNGGAVVTATISAVVVAKSFISYLSFAGTNSSHPLRLGLTNTTTVTCTTAIAVNGHRYIGYEVIEYN